MAEGIVTLVMLGGTVAVLGLLVKSALAVFKDESQGNDDLAAVNRQIAKAIPLATLYTAIGAFGVLGLVDHFIGMDSGKGFAAYLGGFALVGLPAMLIVARLGKRRLDIIEQPKTKRPTTGPSSI